jgi:hypothetical protein
MMLYDFPYISEDLKQAVPGSLYNDSLILS